MNNWLSIRDTCLLYNTSGGIAGDCKEVSVLIDKPVTEYVEEQVNSDSDFENLPGVSSAHEQ